MAEGKITKDKIIESGLFDEAIKNASEFIEVSKEVETQLMSNLKTSKEFLSTLKIEGSKSLQDQAKAAKEASDNLLKLEKVQQESLKAAILKQKAEQELEKTAQQRLKTEKEQVKVTQQATKEQEKQAKAIKDANSEYKQASTQLNTLAKRVKDNSIAGRELSKTGRLVADEFANLKEKIDKADHSAQDFRRNVGNYPKQLKELQKELQKLEPGTKQFNELAKKAGELKDKIADAKDATKAFATESKASTAKTLFGQVVNDLGDLDFKGAAEKAKTFASVVRSISFTEVIAGIKSFGTALFDVGKALLLNPFTLLAAALAGLSYAAYSVVSSFSSLKESTKTLNESIEESKKRIQELGDRFIEATIKIREAQGKLTKEQGEIVRNELKNSNERKAIARKFSDDILALAKELELDLGEIQGNRFKENYTGDINELNRKKRFNNQIRELEKKYLTDSIVLARTQAAEKTAIIAEQEAEEKKKRDEANKEKLKQIQDNNKELNAQLDKLRIENTQLDEQREIDNIKNENKLAVEKVKNTIGNEKTKAKILVELEIQQQQQIQAVRDKYAQERLDKQKKEQEEASALEKKKEEDFIAKIERENDAQQKLTEANNDRIQKELDKRDAKRKENLKQIGEFGNKGLQIISETLQKESDLKQKYYDNEINQREKNIDRQRELAEKGQANTLAFEEEQKAKAELAKEQEKEKELKRQKALLFIKAVSEYIGQGKDPIVALGLAATEVAAATAIAGSFFEGTEKVKDDLIGNPNVRDGYLVRVDGSERVMTGKQNDMVGNMSNEDLAKLAYDYQNGNLLKAATSVNTGSFSLNLENSLALHQLLSLNNKLESLEKTIKNKKEIEISLDNMGNLINSSIENGIREVVIHKRNRKRI